MQDISPMMQQYLQIKEQYKDCIVFFRVGDFYEMFFDDAKLASRELELVLTGKDCGLDERAPMCGVPFHAANTYISRLIEKGYKVAICEQLEDAAVSKGLVKRDIIKIVTPGTITDSNMLDEKKNNYIMSIFKSDNNYEIAYCDISTGEFYSTELKQNARLKLIDEIARIMPSEIIHNKDFFNDSKLYKIVKEKFNISLTLCTDDYFDNNKGINKINNQFKNIKDVQIIFGIYAAYSLLKYIEETQKTNISHINHLNIYSSDEFLIFDLSTRRNLELTQTIRNQTKKGSLLYVLDKTITAMGARMLRKWIEEPLISIKSIEMRQDAISELINNILLKENLKEKLKSIYDLERLSGKIIYENVNARDLYCLKQSLEVLPSIKEIEKDLKSELLKNLISRIDTLDDIYKLLDESIIDNPPISIKDGLIIKDGYNNDVDKYRLSSREGKKWISTLEQKEKELTNIKSLKVGYNKIFGYFIEVTKSNISSVPQDRYIRKQTLSNAERYITPELKEMENTILGAEEKVIQKEYELFCDIRNKISSQIERIQQTAYIIAYIDALYSLAQVAAENDYIKPIVDDSGVINIKDGRHPVVEKVFASNMFVPNDSYLDNNDRLLIITGPNMAGKSTYMRQVALLVIMAQIGSFIPASSAKIGIVDRIFTRIGASDDLSQGQSTFMVEMTEVANILNNATLKSLILLDEVGRGTSTFDGLSIAWSVVEYIANKAVIGAKTLFATHYHELTELEGKIEGIKNYHISVKEHGEDIIFLRKIVRGSADQSYGIQVAKLAGLPDEVLKRAKEILNELESNDILKQNEKSNIIEEAAISKQTHTAYQLDFFSFNNNDIVNELKGIDILNTTPLQAINILDNIIKKLH